LYNVHSSLEAAKKAGIKPVIGTALTKGESSDLTVYCFVENRTGFALLCEMLTVRNKDIPAFDPVYHLGLMAIKGLSVSIIEIY
jgi:DNA polymerase III alpha subunit